MMTNIEETSNLSVETRGIISVDSLHNNVHNYDTIVSYGARQVLEIIFYATSIAALSVIGSAANVINIIIFWRQGLNDSVNISLCGLAVADLSSSLPLIWSSICFNPLFRYSNIGFDSVQVMYLTAGWPHGCFIRIASWITAFITFERCVCVALPLKVKNIIKPKRTFIIIVAMYGIIIVSVSPIYFSVYIAPSFHIRRNKTLVGLLYSSFAAEVQNVSSSINVFTQFSSLTIIIACTITLVHTLRVKSLWRRNATSVYSSGKSDSLSTRDKRVMKMVALISIIFIVCSCPNVVNLIMMAHYSLEYSSVGSYQNSYQVSWGIVNSLEVFNSSVNILVYYKMSSKFRVCFNKLFGIDTPTGKDT